MFLLVSTCLFSLVFVFVFIVVIFCYVSFIVSEVKLFVRHTLFFVVVVVVVVVLFVFFNCMSSSPISYSFLMSS